MSEIMKFTAILMVSLVLLMTILMAGCTSQSADKDSTKTAVTVKPTDTAPKTTVVTDNKETDKQSNGSVNKISSVKDGSNNKSSSDGKYYYNIRIVPASVLEQLQKEIGPDEYLVHNDKGYAIGIVSSDELVLRGDLVQIAQATGKSGKEFDKIDVATHLIDIAFGSDNAKITLFKADKDYKFWFDAYFTNSDVDYVRNLSKFLNTISGTTQFEDEEVALGFLQTNYAVVPYNFYNIRIVTQKILDKYYDDRKDSEHLFKDDNGKLIGIVDIDHLYLLDSIKEEDRKYYILKGVLYSLGLHGTSFNDKESFFYRNQGANKELSDLDIESIKLLYGGGLKTGNTLEDVKKPWVFQHQRNFFR